LLNRGNLKVDNA